MNLNDAQTKFVTELQTMLPLYQGSADARLKTPATNLEWNLKKLSGQGGEDISGATFAQRTQADLELIATSLAQGAAGQAFAVRGAAEVGDLFGTSSTSGTAVAAPSATVAGTPSTDGASAASASAGAASPSSPISAGGMATDVKAILNAKADAAGEKLAWKTSVVDLLKLLGKDSDQAARHRYAVALGFPEDQIGKMPSNEFNTWLHGQLMSVLAHNSGALPSNIA